MPKRPCEESTTTTMMTRSRIAKTNKVNAHRVLGLVRAHVNASTLAARLPTWTTPNRDDLVDAYLHFLTLQVVYYNQCGVFPMHWSPSLIIDSVWHLHILDVCQYYKDCMALCGTLIPHLVDNQDLPPVTKQYRRSLTSAYYRAQFEEEPPIEYWQTIPVTEPAVASVADIAQVFALVLPLVSAAQPHLDIMQIFARVCDSDSRTYTLQCTANDTIAQLKMKIVAKLASPTRECDIRIIFSGQQPPDSHTVAMCNITKESTIQVLYRLRGC